MGSKGKGRRRRELNFNDAHASSRSNLPPPPSYKDATAIPSKLRKIMQLKGLSSHGHSSSPGMRDAKELIRRTKTNKASVHPALTRPLTSTVKQGATEVQHAKPLPEPNEKVSASANRKRERGGDMKMLMNKLGVTPAHKGIREQRKRFLEEKKSRKKQKLRHADTLSVALHEQELIPFGEVVQAPPKLSRPMKGLKQAQSSTLSQKRITLQTIEAYRQRKGWDSRPGNNIPFNNAQNVVDAELSSTI